MPGDEVSFVPVPKSPSVISRPLSFAEDSRPAVNRQKTSGPSRRTKGNNAIDLKAALSSAPADDFEEQHHSSTATRPETDEVESSSAAKLSAAQSSNLKQLVSYVPDVILHCCLQNVMPPLSPRFHRCSGALMLLDISGFSSLASQLAKEEALRMGPSSDGNTEAAAIGAEKMRNVMDTIFACLTDVISGNGGDVIKLAGDLVICTWTRTSGQSLATVTAHAAQCAMEANERLSTLKVHDFVTLGAHSGIGTGEILCLHAGGARGRYQFFVSGEAFRQASMVVNETKKGEIALSEEAWKCVGKYFEGVQKVGEEGQKFYMLHGARGTTRLLHISKQVSRQILIESITSGGGNKALENVLRAYIANPVIVSLATAAVAAAAASVKIASKSKVAATFDAELDSVDITDSSGRKLVSRMSASTLLKPKALSLNSASGSSLNVNLPSHPTLLPATVIAAKELAAKREAQDAGKTIANADGEVDTSAWMGALRSMTIVFVNVMKLDLSKSDSFQRLQEVVFLTQLVLHSFEGTLKEFVLDDKGSVVVAGFGLPPFTHEDDALRAVMFSVRLQKEFQSIGLDCSVGVTTGNCYCGVFGSPLRREFCIVGEKVNMAARLMSKGMKMDKPSVVVDLPTYTSCNSQISFSALEPITVKGSTGLIDIFVPKDISDELMQGALDGSLNPLSGSDAHDELGGAPELIGRKDEMALLIAQVQALKLQGSSGAHLIIGEGGVGKNRLALEISRLAEVEFDVAVIKSECFKDELTKPFAVAGGILDELLARTQEDFIDADVKERGKMLLTLMAERAPAFRSDASLLNGPLGLEIPDQPAGHGPKALAVSQMDNEQKIERTVRLIVHLIESLTLTDPLLVVQTNAHWTDEASWRVLSKIAEDVPSVLLVLCMRPPVEPLFASFEYLFQARSTSRMSLQPLATWEALIMMRNLFKAEAAEPQIEKYLLARSRGNPLFVREVVGALQSTQSIYTDTTDTTNSEGKIVSTVRLCPGVMLEMLPVPKGINSLMLARMDQLPFTQQMVLRTGAVIGKVFSFALLCAVFPVQMQSDRLLPECEALVAQKFFNTWSIEISGSPALLFEFTSETQMEVAYRALTSKQRQDLHLNVATFISAPSTRELNGKPLVPRARLIELLYHNAMGPKDDACYSYLDEARKLGIDLRSALRETAHINFWQVGRVVQSWLIARASWQQRTEDNGGAVVARWRRMSLSVADDVQAAQVRLGDRWTFSASKPSAGGVMSGLPTMNEISSQSDSIKVALSIVRRKRRASDSGMRLMIRPDASKSRSAPPPAATMTDKPPMPDRAASLAASNAATSAAALAVPGAVVDRQNSVSSLLSDFVSAMEQGDLGEPLPSPTRAERRASMFGRRASTRIIRSPTAAAASTAAVAAAAAAAPHPNPLSRASSRNGLGLAEIARAGGSQMNEVQLNGHERAPSRPKLKSIGPSSNSHNSKSPRPSQSATTPRSPPMVAMPSPSMQDSAIAKRAADQQSAWRAAAAAAAASSSTVAPDGNVYGYINVAGRGMIVPISARVLDMLEAQQDFSIDFSDDGIAQVAAAAPKMNEVSHQLISNLSIKSPSVANKQISYVARSPYSRIASPTYGAGLAGTAHTAVRINAALQQIARARSPSASDSNHSRASSVSNYFHTSDSSHSTPRPPSSARGVLISESINSPRSSRVQQPLLNASSASPRPTSSSPTRSPRPLPLPPRPSTSMGGGRVPEQSPYYSAAIARERM